MNDRFLRACRREPVDATPVWFMRQAGRSLPEYREIRKRAGLIEITRDAALCAEVTLQPVTRLGVDAAILFADITTPLAGIGVDVRMEEGVGPVIETPARTMADVLALQPFDAEASIAPLLAAIALIRGASPVPLIGFAGAPFTVASYIVEGRSSRDAVRIKTFMREDPAAFDALMDALTTMTIAYLRAQVAAGAQALQVFDSWVGSLSPFDYQQSIQPHMRRLFTALAQLDVPTIHFGTDTAGLLGSMAAAGGDVIGLDWRIGLAAGWDQVPDRAVQGNLDPSLLLGPFGAVAEGARSVLDDAAGRSGHIFNLGHGVLPGTDPDDLCRLVDLVHASPGR
ncbi:MAG: uroporphyrinogen decarboxylase [Candidatus Limnocylindrales bacterium]